MSCNTQNWPNFDAWLQTAWGVGGEFWSSGYAGLFSAATNLVFGQNPPYFLDDFLAFFPKFFGLATTLSNCTVTTGTSIVAVPSVVGLNYGQFVQAPGVLPPGSIITAISGLNVTVSTKALVTSAGFALTTYQSSPIPVGVIQLYLNLAYASLVQARWQEQWYVAMGWFCAHYCTLYARSDSSEVFETLATAIHGEVPVGAIPGTAYTLSGVPPGGSLQALTKNGRFLIPGTDYTLVGADITLATPTIMGDTLYATWPIQTQVFQANAPNGAQIAAQGLAGGIQTSKSVGDVSVSYQVLTALEDWGSWNLTLYGQELTTMARVVGSGPSVIW